MLDGIRANAQSWAVKLAFGIIIVVFVFWGIGSYNAPSGIVLSVNGESITERDFQMAYRQQAEYLLNAIPNMTQQELDDMDLSGQVLRSLVAQKLLLQEAERTGINVSPYELRMAVEQMPYFNNEAGKFDPAIYVELLKNSGQTPYVFEQNLRKDMLENKFRTIIGAPAYASELNAKANFNFMNEKRIISYLFYDMKPFWEQAAPTEAQISAAYTERANLFALPARVHLEYIDISPQSLADPASITDEALAAAYEQNKSKYSLPEQIQARHLLMKVDAKATEAEAAKVLEAIQAAETRIRNGEDFAAVAKELGQDGTAPNGGDLGWFEAAQMVPEFSQAAFALEPGALSAPVRTAFGYHLIKVEDKKPATVRSLEEVKDELRAQLAEEQATAGVQDKLDSLLIAVLGGTDMATAAAQAKLSVTDTGLVNVTDLEGQLGIRPIDVQTIIASPANKVLDTPFTTTNGFALVKVVENLPESQRPLEEVRESLVEDLTRANARTLAQAEAEKARAAFVDNQPDPAQVPEVKVSAPFDRSGYIPELGMAIPLVKDIYAAEAGPAWLPAAYAVDEGAVLAHFDALELPADEAWESQKPTITAEMLNNRKDQLFGVYLELLSQNAKIKEHNLSVLKRQSAAVPQQ